MPLPKFVITLILTALKGFIYHIKSPILFLPLVKYDYVIREEFGSHFTVHSRHFTNKRQNKHTQSLCRKWGVSLVTLPDNQYKTCHFTETTYLLYKLSQNRALNWILPLKRAGQ